MKKRGYPSEKVIEWMIFYNNRTGRCEYLPSRYPFAYQLDGTVLGSLTGTEEDAKREAERRKIYGR